MGAVVKMLKTALNVLGAGICYRYNRMKTAISNDRKGWAICLVVLLVTAVRCGLTYSFGIIIVELESEYHRSLVEQNWIGTLSFFVSQTSAPLSVAFIRSISKDGYRVGALLGTIILCISCASSSLVQGVEWMFFTHSFLYGVGSSLLYMASSLVIGNHFDVEHEYHVMATSILLCGYPIGSLLFNPLNAWLVGQFGWRVTFRCLGAMILITCVPCCWLFTPKESPSMQRLVESQSDNELTKPVERTSPKKAAQNCLREIRLRPEILLWYIGNCLNFLCYYMPFVNLAFYMQLKGIPPSDSSWTLTLLSLAECITYIVASFLGDYLKGHLVFINIASQLMLAVICVMWPFVDVDFTIIVVISMALGGCLGLTIVYNYAASVEVTQLPQDRAWAFTNMWSGLGVVLGPVCSGAVYDWRHSYDDMFYVVGAVYSVSTLTFCAIPLLKYYRNRRNQTAYSDINGVTQHCKPVFSQSSTKSSDDAGWTANQSSPDDVERIGLSKYARSYDATESR